MTTSVVASGRLMKMTVLTTVSVATTYNSNTFSGFGGTRVGKDFKILLELNESHYHLIIPLKSICFS
jgi:hypothetical protein